MYSFVVESLIKLWQVAIESVCFLVSQFSHSAARHDRFCVEKSSFVSEKSEPKVVVTGVLNGEKGSCGVPLITRQYYKKKTPKEISVMFARFSWTTLFFLGGGDRMRLDGISFSLLSLWPTCQEQRIAAPFGGANKHWVKWGAKVFVW